MLSKTENAASEIKRLIEDGTFASGSRMPPERELARRLGLSQGTVTKAVSMLASEGFVRKVHGSGNYVASFRLPKKGIDICFLAEMAESERINPIWHMIFESFCEASLGSGLNVALKLLPLAPEKAVEGVEDGLSQDGLIVAAIGLHPGKVQAVMRTGRPVLWLEEHTTPLPGPAVCMDNFEAGRLVGRHLMEQGCSRLLYLTYAFEKMEYASDRRLDGFLAGLRESGRAPSISIHPCYCSVPEFKTLLQGWLEGADGVFCFCDILASVAMKAASSFGKRPPEDFALAGVDDLPVGEFLPVSITTVRQPCEKIGRIAFDMALRMLGGEKLEGVLRIKPELIVRESSRRGAAKFKAS